MAQFRLIAAIVLVWVPAMAQPVIIPLEKQPEQSPREPIASAPPVAPPVVPPSVPETAIARGADAEQQEQAAQPPETSAPR